MTNLEGRRAEYILKESYTGRYLGKAIICSSSPENFRPYKPGDHIPLPDQQLFSTNSARVRKCEVLFVDRDISYKYDIAYLKITDIEEKIEGNISPRIFKGDFLIKKRPLKSRGIDWSGSDGWLNLS